MAVSVASGGKGDERRYIMTCMSGKRTRRRIWMPHLDLNPQDNRAVQILP